MWSVGVILYILLCGFPPFDDEELPVLLESISQAQYDFPGGTAWDDASDGARTLVSQVRALAGWEGGARVDAPQRSRVSLRFLGHLLSA